MHVICICTRVYMLTAFSTYKVHKKDLIIDRISLIVFTYDPPASGSIPGWWNSWMEACLDDVMLG